MKKVLLLICLGNGLYGMDRPAQSPFVKDALNLWQQNAIPGLIDSAPAITLTDIELLATVRDAGNRLKQYVLQFWLNHGVPFLLKVNLVQDRMQPQPQSLTDLAAKKVAENISAGKESPAKFQQLPRDLKDLVLSKNADLIRGRFENILGVFDKQPASANPQIEQIKAQLVKDLWAAALEKLSIPSCIQILVALRKSFKRVGKAEPLFLINEMRASLSQKICSNIQSITAYLREKNLLTPLVNAITANSAEKPQAQALVNLLNATPETCPILVTGELNKMIAV